MKHCNLEEYLLTTNQVNNLKVHKLRANNKKTLVFAFWTKRSLGAHTVQPLRLLILSKNMLIWYYLFNVDIAWVPFNKLEKVINYKSILPAFNNHNHTNILR